jgi:hypothetical protein
MPWKLGQSGNPRGRPPGRRLSQLRGRHLVLRDYLERQILENQDVVDSTIVRILRSPRQLPRLLLLYAKVNVEVQVPQTLIIERERVARIAEQARLLSERDALREAQWAAEDAEAMEDETELERERHQAETGLGSTSPT